MAAFGAHGFNGKVETSFTANAILVTITLRQTMVGVVPNCFWHSINCSNLLE
jgi:hypothetical protein